MIEIIEICTLSEKHFRLLDDFSCVESDEELIGYKSKEKQKIRSRSKALDMFLKSEAYEDQNNGLSTTHLLIVKNNSGVEKIGAYISLCNDSIRLQNNEKMELGYPYEFIPSMKIAKLAVSNEFKNQGLGKHMINVAALKGLEVREISGLVFMNLDCYKHKKSYYESFGFVLNKSQLYDEEHYGPLSMRIGLDEFLETIPQ